MSCFCFSTSVEYIKNSSLNGPAWTLFFEYIGNILYAVFIRRLPNTIVSILVLIAAAALIDLAVTSAQGDVICGWSIEWTQFRIGLTRLCYPFFAGLLLSRISKPGRVKHAFLWCSLLLIAMLAMPRVGGHDNLWMNGLYDSLSVIFVFPLIVYLGASGEVKEIFPHASVIFLAAFPTPFVSYTIPSFICIWYGKIKMIQPHGHR